MLLYSRNQHLLQTAAPAAAIPCCCHYAAPAAAISCCCHFGAPAAANLRAIERMRPFLWMAMLSGPWLATCAVSENTQAMCCRTITGDDCIVSQNRGACPMDRPGAFCSTCPQNKWRPPEIATLAVDCFGALGTLVSTCHVNYEWRRSRRQGQAQPLLR